MGQQLASLTQNGWVEPPSRFPSFGEDRDLTVNELWNLFLRRRAIVFGTVAIFFGLAVLLCLVTTRRYLASGAIQVQKDGSDALGLESMIGGAESASDALDANVTIQTQADILKSDTLALKVIQDLNLEKTQDFQPHFSALGWVLGFITPRGKADPRYAALEDSPGRRTHALKVFARNLKVKPVAGTRIIEITYLNPDPHNAALVVNHLAQGLADYNFQTRYNATSQAAEWLNGQLSDLRKQSEEQQAKVIDLQRQSGVFSFGDPDLQGRQQVYSADLDRLQQSTSQLTQAESSRILRGAIYEAVKNGDPETISGLAGASTIASASSSGVTSSLTLIQNLRAEEALLNGQVQQAQIKYGPAYPKLNELKSNLASIQASLHAEVTRVGQRAKNDYVVAQQVENNARAVFLRQKHDADALNNKAIEYTIARQESDESRALYQNLLHKLKEAGVIAGLKSSNITIIDPARDPSSPAKPNVLLYLAASVAGGLAVGLSAAFLRDATDSKIQNLPELEAYLGEAPFAVLPFHKAAEQHTLPAPGTDSPFETEIAARQRSLTNFPVLTEPACAFSESLRALRTSLFLAKEGAPPQVILVTSSIAAEGKSMVSANLAGLLAQQGRKVLLVDADLRRPVLHRRLKVNGTKGLSSLLTETGLESAALSAPVTMQQLPNLDILPSGPVPPFPAELLSSEQMKQALGFWRTKYDFIVLDGAPVLPVTDSVLLSSLADQTLLVARYKVTDRQALERSYRLLKNTKPRRSYSAPLPAAGSLEALLRSEDPAENLPALRTLLNTPALLQQAGLAGIDALASGRRPIGIVLNGVERAAHSSYAYASYGESPYHKKKEEFV